MSYSLNTWKGPLFMLPTRVAPFSCNKPSQVLWTHKATNWKYLDPIRKTGLFARVWILKLVTPAGNYQIPPTHPTEHLCFVYWTEQASLRFGHWWLWKMIMVILQFQCSIVWHRLLLQTHDLINLLNPQLGSHDKRLTHTHKHAHTLFIMLPSQHCRSSIHLFYPAHLRFSA